MPDNAQSGGGWVEVVIAVVLSVSGLLTSWASFQGGLWGGEEAVHYNRAGELRVIATRAKLQADSWRSTEMQLFNSWLQAEMRGEAKLADFYKDRFPADMRPAFDAWLAQSPLTNPHAPPGPFVDPAYRPFGTDGAERLDAEADAAIRAGRHADSVSDLYTQGTVLLATAMFFGGIGQVFDNRRLRLVLLGIAVLACIGGVVRILSLPNLTPG